MSGARGRGARGVGSRGGHGRGLGRRYGRDACRVRLEPAVLGFCKGTTIVVAMAGLPFGALALLTLVPMIDHHTVSHSSSAILSLHFLRCANVSYSCSQTDCVLHKLRSSQTRKTNGRAYSHSHSACSAGARRFCGHCPSPAEACYEQIIHAWHRRSMSLGPPPWAWP